jgi:hypothetical protein
LSFLPYIKTELLIQELVNRCSDQLFDPEPQYDGILSFASREDLETIMDELVYVLGRRISLRSEEGETKRDGEDEPRA